MRKSIEELQVGPVRTNKFTFQAEIDRTMEELSASKMETEAAKEATQVAKNKQEEVRCFLS